jgi:hypothetical protein
MNSNEELYTGHRETKYDVSQILFGFLVKNVFYNQIIQV